MMQEHHPLELYIIEDCFDSAIWKAKELLEKEKTNAIEDYRTGRTDQQSGHGETLNADNLIKSLGTTDGHNEYKIKPDKDGEWWIEHNGIGSGEPLKQWLTGKP